MSAITGAFSYGAGSLEPGLLDRMLDRLAHRGPDARGEWSDGPVALGAQQFWTTPEAVGQELPLVTERHVLTANVRLDNRDELCSALGLPRDASDERLLLAAYARWGEACPKHFLGPFAFAVFDRSNNHLFCARDHFGVMPFYYCDVRPAETFVFATEIKALFECEGLEREINEVRLVEYLTGKTKRDREITIYKNVWRLPPGHSLVVDRAGTRLTEYWSLEPQETLQLGSDEEYAERLLEIMQKSVASRMRSNHSTGSELSGGLDSTFVACIGRDLSGGKDWHAISNVFDRFPECDERQYMDQALQQGGIISHRTVSDDIGPLSMLPSIFKILDDPYVAGNHHMVWQCYQTARENNVRVLLDGYDGDTTIGHGPEILLRMAREGRWNEYWRELQLAAKHLEGVPDRHTLQVELANPQLMLQHHVDTILDAHVKRLNYGGFARTVSALQRELSIDGRRLYRRYWRRMIKAPFNRLLGDGVDQVEEDLSFLNPDFRNRSEIQERLRMHEQEEDFGEYERAEQLKVLRSDIFSRSLEIMDHYAAATGIEVRHPYMDRRLIEYCLSMPLRLSFSNGWSRWVMRLAMEGIVPEEIRWRSGKANLARTFDHGLFEIDRPLLEEAIARSTALSRYVDAAHLQRLYKKKDELTGREIWQLAFLAQLSLWWSRNESVDNPKTIPRSTG